MGAPAGATGIALIAFVERRQAWRLHEALRALPSERERKLVLDWVYCQAVSNEILGYAGRSDAGTRVPAQIYRNHAE